ncbi:unnamed protein product [Schistocephalus solidus]|uniref:Secreted RxLR effector peptide protein n=1 Tax=Schistocephalus solidus TaxID=70667 RepID=A0A183TQN5_SCHSO|nr:unnamed protein product [Schistocephalus solidus]
MRLLLLVLLSHLSTLISGRRPLWPPASYFEPDDLRSDDISKRASALDYPVNGESDAMAAGRLKYALREIARRGDANVYFSSWRPHSRFGRR